MALLCLTICIAQTIVSTIYPAVESYKALKEYSPSAQKMWLSYWVYYAAIMLVEYLTFGFIEQQILKFICQKQSSIPLYSTVKAVFFLWLYHKDFLGYLFLEQTLSPIFQQAIQATKPLQDKFGPFLAEQN